MSKSSKHKLNTKSSTEAELVGASDYLSYPIWAKKFLEAQGYPLEENIFYQDNQSTIRFEKNGRKSCGPNSRHIDIRYFFIKDRIDLERIEVQHCLTEQMLADFFTKPLQGNLFRKLRAVVMGYRHVDSLKTDTSAATKERVGESEITGKEESTANVAETCPKVQGHNTDGQTQEPPIMVPVGTARPTYAGVVKGRIARGTGNSRIESERPLRPLTLLK